MCNIFKIVVLWFVTLFSIVLGFPAFQSKYSGLLGCDALSLYEWCLMFWGFVVSLFATVKQSTLSWTA
jgi:hypothetical protein